MYAIRRHRAAINAWCWRVRFKRKGQSFAKSFYDLACGGNAEAEAMAIAWRDEKLAEIEPLSMADFHALKRSNNVSGVPGVHFHITPVQPLGFWQATIHPADKRRRAKSFSVRRHGNDEAFRLAVAARTEMLAMVRDQPYLYHPDAKGAALFNKSRNRIMPCFESDPSGYCAPASSYEGLRAGRSQGRNEGFNEGRQEG